MYYLKDIILGLRKEYLNNERRLNQLKQYLVCNYEKVRDYNISSVFNGEVINLVVNIERRQSFIEKMLKSALERLELIKEKDTTIEISDTKPYIKENAFGLEVKQPFDNDFSRIVKKIKNDPLIYRIGNYQTAFQEKGLCYYIDINPQFMNFTVLDDETFADCCYNAKDDDIIVRTNSDKEFGEKDLEKLFYIPVEKSKIPIYNQSVIDEALSKDEFSIFTGTNLKKVKLKIKEYDDGYYLRKRK